MSLVNHFLGSLPIFKSLSQEDVASFGSKFIQRTYKQGTVLYLRGEPLDRIFIVFQGRIRLHNTNPEGSKLFVRYYNPGDLFPRFGFFRDTVYLAEAQVDTDSSLLVMMRDDFERLLQTYPEITPDLIRMMGEHIQNLESQLGETIVYDSTERVILLLLRLAKSHPFENKVAKSVRLQERFTHRELAQMVGTTRETVSRIINRLKQSGYIIPEDGYMILQTDKLKKIVCSHSS